MCRLFGFRSVLQGTVHRSLSSADNALGVQSRMHPDGWGVAYYVGGAPHVVRGTGEAGDDRIFHKVSGILSSQTVIAHVRKATQGAITPFNCHPFQYGRWILAHNGDIPDFAEVRPALMDAIAPKLRGFLLGDTDSEVVFHVFLTELSRRTDLNRRGTPADAVAEALHRTVDIVRTAADGRPGVDDALLTLLVTDGESLVAHQGGKELHVSTWKKRCSQREGCAYFSAECEAPTTTGFVNHLVVSSEPLQGENHWDLLPEGHTVGIDGFLHLHRWTA